MKFESRTEAGKRLAEELEKYTDLIENSVILAIPRGGVSVAYEVAKKLEVRMSLIITKKLTLPQNKEVAIGAIAPDGTFGLNKDITKYRQISKDQLNEIKNEALSKVENRLEKYMGKTQPDVEGKNTIIIDDGVATGFTAKIAGKYVKNRGARKVILAIPVGPVGSVSDLKKTYNEVICLNPVDSYSFAVGVYYKDFHQNTDEELFEYIEKAKKEDLFFPDIKISQDL
jgi:predicted phosphoribosyltransferase